MATKFRCPKCKSDIKVGRLRSSYTCPNCKLDMLITKEEKNAGFKFSKKRK